MIEIRRATIADKQAIYEFLPKAYKEYGQYKFPERWEWQFIKNPFRKGDELPIWIAVNENGEVVGQICTMFEPLKVGLETYCMGWPLDLIVLPEYQGQKIGYKLLKANYDAIDILLALVMADSSRHIITKLGGIPMESVAVFDRVARFDRLSIFTAFRNRLLLNRQRKVLLQLFHFFWLDGFIATLINGFVWIRDLGLARFNNPDIEIKQIEKFDYTANQLWDSVSPQYFAIVERKSEFLNWKYIEQPHMNYKVFTATKGRNLCGYIIFRTTRKPESNTGVIADLFAPVDDEATVHSLLAFAVRYFKDQKVKYIEVASSCGAFKRAFLTLGFRKYKDQTPLFFSNNKTLTKESAHRPGGWFFGRSDHDWDQFPYG
jgi:GNAT superfamily N-acetyltransferase